MSQHTSPKLTACLATVPVASHQYHIHQRAHHLPGLRWVPSRRHSDHNSSLSCTVRRASPFLKNGQDQWPLHTGQDFLPNHMVDGIDFASLHLWPDNWARTDDYFGRCAPVPFAPLCILLIPASICSKTVLLGSWVITTAGGRVGSLSCA